MTRTYSLHEFIGKACRNLAYIIQVARHVSCRDSRTGTYLLPNPFGAFLMQQQNYNLTPSNRTSLLTPSTDSDESMANDMLDELQDCMESLGFSDDILDYQMQRNSGSVEAVAIVIPNECCTNLFGESTIIASMAITLVVHTCGQLIADASDGAMNLWGYTIKIRAVFGTNLLEEDAGRQFVRREYAMMPRRTLTLNLNF
jgi:hypothetical protein